VIALVAKKRQNDVSVVYNDMTIYVTTDDPYHTYFIWTLNEFDDTIFCGESCQTTLKPEYLIKNGLLNIKVFILDVKSGNATFQIQAQDVCIIQNCKIFCADYFNNFICYSAFYQAIMIICFIITALALAYLIFFIWYKVTERYKGLYIIQTPNSVPMTAVTIFFFILILPCSSQCITSTIIFSEIQSCSFQNGTDTCTLQLNQNVILPHLDNKVCIMFASTTGQYLGSMNVTYDLSLIQAQTTPLYFTSDWTGLACSGKSCRNSDYCSSGCTQDQTVLNNYLTGQCVLWPGKSQCQASCGCAGCGCFLCSSACLASRYAFEPQGSAIQVNDILSTNTYPRVIIELELNGTLSTYFSDVLSTAVAGPFTVNLLGSFAGPSTVFGTNKFVTRGSNAYLAQASDYNNPQFGTVGDIQSQTISSFGLPSPTGFIFPSTVVASVASDNSVTYSFPTSGAQLLNSNTILPKQIGNLMWTFSGNTLYATNSDPPAITLSIYSTNPMILSYKRTSVCPAIDNVTVNGCFNCPMGFTLTVLVKSNCDAGSVKVSLITSSRMSCFNSFIAIGTTYSPVILQCISYDKQVSGNLTLIGDTTDSILFQTVLNNAPPLTQQEITDIFGNYSLPSDNGNFVDWWNSLTGSMIFVKVLIIAGCILVFLVLFGGALYASYNIYQAYKLRKIYDSLNEEDYDDS